MSLFRVSKFYKSRNFKMSLWVSCRRCGILCCIIRIKKFWTLHDLAKLVSQAMAQIGEQYSILGSTQVRKYDRRALRSLMSVNLYRRPRSLSALEVSYAMSGVKCAKFRIEVELPNSYVQIYFKINLYSLISVTNKIGLFHKYFIRSILTCASGT